MRAQIDIKAQELMRKYIGDCMTSGEVKMYNYSVKSDYETLGEEVPKPTQMSKPNRNHIGHKAN